MTMTEMTNDQLMAELDDAAHAYERARVLAAASVEYRPELCGDAREAASNYARCFREVERRLSAMVMVTAELEAEYEDHQKTKQLLNQYRDAAYRATDECSYMKKSYEALLSAHNALADDRLRIVEERDAMRKVLETAIADLVAVSHSS